MKKLVVGVILFCSIICMGSGIIYLDALHDYENQPIPSYITLDNTGENVITDEVATLGRVLFYDKKMSLDNNTSCSTCHDQSLAFSDSDQVSFGSFGITGRHSMRLVNSRFSAEERFFWDERAATLEEQTTMPIQDIVEMGYSGTFGNPGIESLLEKLEDIEYYNTLFEFAFGDETVTEERIQLALAQFIRSIQSFDSKFDEGRIVVDSNVTPFPNFTAQENQGKNLFLRPIEFGNEGNRIGGGLGCASCHRGPEFSIIPNSRGNGVIFAANGFEIEEGITRSPTLRDMFNPTGELNGPLMHNGLFNDMTEVLAHYNDINASTGMSNPIIDPRLKDGAFTQKLNMTDQEVESVIAFFKTLTGSDVYTNEKWSDPFDQDGQIEVLYLPTSVQETVETELIVSPNPAISEINIDNMDHLSHVEILDLNGQVMTKIATHNISNATVDISIYASGLYVIIGMDEANRQVSSQKFVKL